MADILVSSSAPTRHASNRQFEWAMVLAGVGLGLIAFAWPHSVTETGFARLVDVGFSPAFLAFYAIVVSGVRAYGLYMTGSKPPLCVRLRAAAATLFAFLWAQITLALIVSTIRRGFMPLDTGVFFALFVGEVKSCYRAVLDGRLLSIC